MRARLLMLGLSCLLAACRSEGTSLASAWPHQGLSVDRAKTFAAQVSGAELRKHVEALAAAHRSETPVISELTKAPHTRVQSAAYVAQAFNSLGLTAVTETSNDDGLEVRNVYVDVPGTKRPAEQILVMAHHDAWHTGADDNSSGVAVLIEAARVLKDAAPARTIRLLATDREEQGLIGINRYVKAHQGDQVTLVLNMDTVGFARNEENSQRSPFGFSLPTKANFLLSLANAPAEPALFRFAELANQLPDGVVIAGVLAPGNGHYPLLNDPLRSDHAPYWGRNVPGLFVTDSADFRSPHYHQASDTPETLDYDFFSKVGRTVIGALAAFAEVD